MGTAFTLSKLGGMMYNVIGQNSENTGSDVNENVFLKDGLLA